MKQLNIMRSKIIDYLLEKLFRLLKYFGSHESFHEKYARFLGYSVPHFLTWDNVMKYFQLWEDQNFHLYPVHYYSPIPDTRRINLELMIRDSELIGIDMNIEKQMEFLNDIFTSYKHEYDLFPQEKTDIPHEFYYNNNFFSGIDAPVLYCMVRHFKPSRIIEVGSGFSTFVTAKAATINGNTEVICIEPYPNEILVSGFPGLTRLIKEDVQNVGIDLFLELSDRDILFIDSSHVVKCCGDVNYLYLEVLPRLKKGVIIHVHDIFFPHDYPVYWLKQNRLFWNEQYLLQAFLSFNSHFEVLFCSYLMSQKYMDKVETLFPDADVHLRGAKSFWMRRKRGIENTWEAKA